MIVDQQTATTVAHVAHTMAVLVVTAVSVLTKV
jgi:hypothetical protein